MSQAGDEGRSPARRRPAPSRAGSPAERRARRAATSDPEVVLGAALRFLEVRARSVAETRRHLLDAGYDEALVAGAVERLLGLGILDDVAFARVWVASRDRARPRGERALRDELARKGVSRETVALVLAERDAPGGAPALGGGGSGAALSPAHPPDSPATADERAAAALLERRRAGLERVSEPRLRRQRAYALLARNGFDPDVAARATERFVRAGDEERT